MKSRDYMVRATAADAQIRAFAATTKNLVEEMRSLHNTSPVVSAALGRLLTGGAMMGAMMKGENDLLTLQIKGDGPIGGMTVTADAHGNVKGYANEAQVILPANAAGKLDVGSAVGKGILRVVKDMGLKEPYVGQTILQTGEIAEDLTYYFAVSEQTPSSVGLGVFMEKNNTVKQAGGFILQLMPYAEESVIARLEDNLRQFPSVTAALEEGKNPEQMLEALLDGLPMEIVDTMDVQYRCDCSKQRVERAMISLGKKELEEMIAEGKEVEAGCQFCNQKYKFTVEELERLIL
ncbi:MAG: Hsp33 family molecular chaperone HslO [Kineothrix sp.]|jgi:molecular chaperone Hsp33|nr:Hsp33 family molecular chaperone HslO [Lachnospiraceae bacterium]MCX4343254.1 Hsp33 family molecular chaperone HslO [Kineothrix sp.]